MSILTKASHEWYTRPADERFTSLTDMGRHFSHVKDISREEVCNAGTLMARPEDGDAKGLFITGAVNDNAPALFTNFSFGQLASLVRAPAGYLKDLPSDLAADCINHGLHQVRQSEIGTLVRQNGGLAQFAAATGPRYGRIFNADIVDELIRRFGDGISGQFTVPGEFGKAVEVDGSNTTLYGSDRDMFVFLADEQNRIEVPNRRNGEPGSLARGFFVWNSEVGYTSLGVATFLFDYVCMNRIVWGAEGYEEIRIRHSSGAPGRYLDEVVPALTVYAESSTAGITDAIAKAQAAQIGTKEDVDEFLVKRFGKRAEPIKVAYFADENRPIESLWDVTTAVTAYARGITHQDSRVALEREAGKVMQLAA